MKPLSRLVRRVKLPECSKNLSANFSATQSCIGLLSGNYYTMPTLESIDCNPMSKITMTAATTDKRPNPRGRRCPIVIKFDDFSLLRKILNNFHYFHYFPLSSNRLSRLGEANKLSIFLATRLKFLFSSNFHYPPSCTENQNRSEEKIKTRKE